MTKIICELCGKRMVTEKILASHLAKSHTETVSPVLATEPIKQEEIVLEFTQSVEITINGKKYFGKTLIINDLMTASEIIRIAKEAYGNEILL